MRSPIEELQRLGDELLVVLEDGAVAGVGIDGEARVGQAAGHVGGVGAGDHQVVVAVGDEHGLGDVRQIVGGVLAGGSDRLQLGAPGLQRDSLVPACVRSFNRAR